MVGTVIGVLAPIGALAIPAVAGATPMSSAAIRFVSASAAAGNDASCATAGYGTIAGALKEAPVGATVVVCPGTYHTEVLVTTKVNLVGMGATIDAVKQDTGISVQASGSTVEGFTVHGAIGEGILVTGAPGKPVANVTVRNNVVYGNDLGSSQPNGAGYAECKAQGQIPGDCGEGIHLMSAANSVVEGNTVRDNAGGILLTDELGPNHGNLVAHNVVTDNVDDCGITIAGHSTKGFVKGKLVPSAGGVYGNRIVDNVLIGNGTKGAGAGVILGVPAPGSAVYGNLVRGNTILGNGQSGVTLHSHAPDQYASGNRIVGNLIGVNNVKGDPDFQPADTVTTGVLVRTAASPVSITITGNTIVGDEIGVFASPSVAVAGIHSNHFVSVATWLHRA